MSDTPYSRAAFKATHNSYSGPFNNFDRGSIPEQLDAGIRFIEYDINLADYRQAGDFQLGHEKPGLEVHHGGGNPSTLVLEDWLRIIADWSDTHPGHVPITVGLDLKNNLAALTCRADGNLAALNDHVRNVFGDKLVMASDIDSTWPTVDALRGKVIVVMSGDTKSRIAYLKDHGTEPAIDVNDRGQVVEAHKSQLNPGLWYWGGDYDDRGRVSWHAHGQFDKGVSPAVCINNEGWVVAAHQGYKHPNVYWGVGRFTPNGYLHIGESFKLEAGTQPCVRFVNRDGRDVQLLYQSGGETWECLGQLEPTIPTIAWQAPRRTETPRFDVARAEAAGRRIEVKSDPQHLLRYETGDHSGLVGYDQVLFVEYQRGNPDELAGSWFYACSKKYLPWGQEKCAAGKLVRIWGFGREHAVHPGVSFAATDTPYEDWYQRYCNEIKTVS